MVYWAVAGLLIGGGLVLALAAVVGCRLGKRHVRARIAKARELFRLRREWLEFQSELEPVE